MKRRYYGHAAHLIVGESCRFHIATLINDRYLVSTVGDYRARADDEEPTTIGSNRLYETFVFDWSGDWCDCGCGLPKPTEWHEIDTAAYNDAPAAAEGHEAMCRKYEAKRQRRAARRAKP